MTAVSRRAVLRALGGAAAGSVVGVPFLSGVRGATSAGGLLRSRVPLPAPFTQPLRQPAVLAPARSTVDTDYYEVVQRKAVVELLPGVPTEIWGYQGTFPGPTIVSRRGRTTVVRHRNELPVPTVVHLHGGHTPAAHDGYPTDATRDSREYVYPMRQRAATLWYHDHRMDFTGPGVWRGLAGYHLVTDDEEDRLPVPRGERDLVLMLADRSFAADGALAYPSLDPTLTGPPGVTGPYTAGVLGDVVLVNGVPWPYHEVAAVRYRLRLLNASNARRYRLVLDPPPTGGGGLVQIGTDGGLLDRPLVHDALELAPAQRYDVVVDFSRYRPGTGVTLVNRFDGGTAGRVLRFHVTGRAADDSTVPARLSTVEPLAGPDAAVTRTLVFRAGDVHGMRGWLINGEPFDPGRSVARPRLGTTEVWRLVTDFHHPIHLHLAPFQVLSRGIAGPGAYDHGWKDTVDLRPAEEARIAVRFEDYAGRFVFHCHNLEHEDMAMMGNVTTVT
jgi:spore coat protein A